MDKTLHNSRTETVTFGFWTYLMTDCVLFACFFVTFAVLRNSTFGGPVARELFKLPYVFQETVLLLTSSFTCGLAMLAAQQGATKQVIAWFGVTLALGLAFLTMELA